MHPQRLTSIILFALFTATTWAIKPDTVYIRTPEALGLQYRDLTVTTTDGYQIATWFFPAQDSLSVNATATQPAPTLIICNGDAGNMSYFQLYLVFALTRQGFNIATFDWRGFGKSTPFEMDHRYLCYTEMLEDYRAVVEEVAKQPEVKPGIAVMGWSTGAYLSMITAYQNPAVSMFVGRSLCTDLEDCIPLLMETKNKTRDQLIIPDDFPMDLMPIKIAPRFTKPIFLINGENDLQTPVWMSEKVLAAVPDNTPKKLMTVPNAAHGGMQDPILLDFENFVRELTAFIWKLNATR